MIATDNGGAPEDSSGASKDNDAPGYRQIVRLAIPIILANSATPLLALSDIAVIGHFGDVADLGAVALGSLILNFLFWGFGFLRMGTSGFIAQAIGRHDALEIVATLARALLIAAAIGLALIALQWPLAELAFRLFGGSAAVETIARDFFTIRIWGAPAALGLYVLMGYFIGSGRSRALLATQLLLNGCNLALDWLFAGALGWGAAGIALGTTLSEWLTLLVVGFMTWRLLRGEVTAVKSQLGAALRSIERLRALLVANVDILIRTLALLAGFVLFTDQGARFGDALLAGNHLLLQLISFSAFFLDGFAYVTEALAGRAFGAGDRRQFFAVVRRATWLAALTALLLALLIVALGPQIIALLTGLQPVQQAATTYLPFAAGYVLLSFAAFQLDGVFIGTTQTRALRNAALLAMAAFIAALPLARYGNAGLWSAFLLFVVARAIALGLHFRGCFHFDNKPESISS